MKFGSLDSARQVIVVAEIGNNHEGDFEQACALVRAAAAAGADAVKFQTIAPERLVSADQVDRLAQLRRYQFSRAQFEALAGVAADADVAFFSTPFDVDAVGWLDAIVPVFKIASGDNDCWPLLDRVAATGKPLIVSLGFGAQARAHELAGFLADAWQRHGVAAPDLALLHCVAAYPVPDAAADLGAIARLRAAGLPATIGYSDHTLGTKAAELAVAAGARIVEKHFTLDRGRTTFRDHALSADPDDLRGLVDAIRRVEHMFAVPPDGPADANATGARRSIAAARDLPAGTRLGPEDLTWLRPGSGLRPGGEAALIGRILRQAVAAGHLLSPDHLD